MKKPNRLSLVLAVLIAAALACNLPNSQTATPAANAAYTAAAQTVAAELTQAAQVQPTATTVPPTATQVPTNTAAPAVTIVPLPTLILPVTATSGCDSALFVADITVKDNTIMAPGQTFTKTWRLKNNGSCSWTPSYAVTFVSGDQMNGPDTQALVGNVNPGDTVDISVNLTAPTQDGTYTGYWKLRNASGAAFPSPFYVQIKVSNSGGGGTTGTFAVTSVTYTLSYWNDASNTHCPRIVAHMVTNGPGTITYYWKRSDGASTSSETVSVPSAGTFTVRYDWARGSTWAGTPAWVGLYVDNPNHQDFGHYSFSVACTSP